MITYNYRMFEGDPLHYCTTGFPVPVQPNYLSYFNRFQSYEQLNMSEELVMPHSPSGSQSDSDNSISSVETFVKEIQVKPPCIKTSEQVQCCWSSCGIIFETLDQLAIHVSRVHSASGPGGLFYCGWKGCARNNKGFNARYKMLVHVRTHTNEKPHHCYQCDKSFSRAENLKIHSRSHSGEKPYVCPVPGCCKAYSNSSDRFKHTRTHQVDKPYQCKVPGCPKRYTDPSSLRKHVKTYKHFLSENRISEANIKTSVIVTNKKFESHLTKNNETSDPIQPFTRCASKDCAKSPGALKLEGYINISSNCNTSSWNRTSCNTEPKLFRPYQIEDKMEIDLPLDLSITRRHV